MTAETFKAMVAPTCAIIGWLVFNYLAIGGVADWKWQAGGTFVLLGIWRTFRELEKRRNAKVKGK